MLWILKVFGGAMSIAILGKLAKLDYAYKLLSIEERINSTVHKKNPQMRHIKPNGIYGGAKKK